MRVKGEGGADADTEDAEPEVEEEGEFKDEDKTPLESDGLTGRRDAAELEED